MKAKYHCMDCGIKIASRYAKRCRSCGNKHKKGGITLGKFYCIDCGKRLKSEGAYRNKRCMKCNVKNRPKSYYDYLRGSNNPGWKGGKPKCPECGGEKPNITAKRCSRCSHHARRGVKFTKNHREKIGIALTGKNNHFWGHPPKWSRVKYKNVSMRSSWEVAYAKYLDKNNIKWLYESKTFNLGNCTYTPDFYLPETNTYVEIKGYWYREAKTRYLKFRRKFGNIELLNKQRLKKLGVL